MVTSLLSITVCCTDIKVGAEPPCLLPENCRLTWSVHLVPKRCDLTLKDERMQEVLERWYNTLCGSRNTLDLPLTDAMLSQRRYFRNGEQQYIYIYIYKHTYIHFIHDTHQQYYSLFRLEWFAQSSDCRAEALNK